MYYLYIIKSTSREYYYVGITNNIDERLKYHNKGKVKSTKPYKPFVLAYKEEFSSFAEARKREVEFKISRSLKDDTIKNIKLSGPIV